MILADGMDYSTRTQTAAQRVRAQYTTVRAEDYDIMRRGFEAMLADRDACVARLDAAREVCAMHARTIEDLQRVLTRNAQEDALSAHRRALVALTCCGALFACIAWFGIIAPVLGY